MYKGDQLVSEVQIFSFVILVKLQNAFSSPYTSHKFSDALFPLENREKRERLNSLGGSKSISSFINQVIKDEFTEERGNMTRIFYVSQEFNLLSNKHHRKQHRLA